MATDLYPLAFVTGIGTGLVLGPHAHRVATVESNVIRSRASAIARAERTQRLLAAARERLGRR